MLFSEPKIPQSLRDALSSMRNISFSALQRAENSSIDTDRQSEDPDKRFSALQRAENSSISAR